MRSLAFFASALFLVACGSAGDGPARPDGGGTDSGGSGTDSGGMVDSGGGMDSGGGGMDLGAVVELSGMVTTDQCGNFHVATTVDIPAGSDVTICAGAHVAFDSGAALRVHGTLHVAGTAAARVTLDGSGWSGIIVNGTLDAHFMDVTGAMIALSNFTGATTTVTHSTITAPSRAALGFRIAGGATIDSTQILGGATEEITGGMLSMTNSTIDLMIPVGNVGDCTDFAGGGATLNQVRFTGCHCPLHFNSTNMPITVTNSVLDVATNPIMIANSTATVHHNALLGASTAFLDIGGHVTADVAGNWWGGPTARTSAYPSSTITGTTDVLTAMPTDVGPM